MRVKLEANVSRQELGEVAMRYFGSLETIPSKKTLLK
jgi:hypothetical protein